MNKSCLLEIFGLLAVTSLTAASYAGPFLFWGMENLNSMKAPALQAIDDKSLRDVYSSASSIVVFIRNATTELNHENFPRLSEIVGATEWLYLPQESLPSDPLEYNVNAEVFVLTGPVEQQDVEIAALYRDAQVNYGQKNILGILATRHDHVMYKRQAPGSSSTTTDNPSTEANQSEEAPVANTFYMDKKAMLMVYEPPVLVIGGNKPSEDITYDLSNHLQVTSDERVVGVFKLIVKFKPNNNLFYIKFVFNIFGGGWVMKQVEYDNTFNTTVLDLVGSEVPSAPLNFSYVCGETFVYRKNGTSLTLKQIQAQPRLYGSQKFSDAFDCVGVLTPGIASGLFVTAIIAIALTIAITAILEIKTPNKFENRSSKQLTFTVQE